MDITTLIKERRATPARFLAKTEIAREVIEQLLENATWAPNHKKTEPWRFKVFTGSAKMKFATEAFSLLKKEVENGFPAAPDKIQKFKNTLEHVPVVMAIILQRDRAERVPEWEEIAAVSMAVQNMWLTATGMGLGAFWATPGFMHLFEKMLDIQPGQRMLGFFYIGEIAMDYPSPGRGDAAAKVEWMGE